MNTTNKTLRLLFPQWQGGSLPEYYWGAKLLSFLAPETTGPVEEVSVEIPIKSMLKTEDGINGRSSLLMQIESAQSKIDKHKPDSIVTFGGDCLVDLVPFSYLNNLYNGELGLLWIDAHPDVMTPEQYENAHAMVLGNLLGQGDEEFKKIVKTPFNPQNVMFAGLGATLPYETQFIQKHNIRVATANDLNQNSNKVIEWIDNSKIKKIAIHFDLDVINPKEFHSLYFSNPGAKPEQFDGITKGEMKFKAVQRLIMDVAQNTEVVGLGITEYLPWDAVNLIQMLSKLPLLNNE